MGRSTAPSSDPRSGFRSSTRTFHSLRPHVSLPPSDQPLSITSFSLSLLSSLSLPPSHPIFVDASSNTSLSLGLFLSQVRSLSSALRSPLFSLSLSKGHVAFILSPTCLDVPILYFSLLSLGVVLCPSNPSCTARDISRQFRLVSPSIAFATSATAHLLPPNTPTILLDSDEFLRMLHGGDEASFQPEAAEIHQLDTAVILFSSGTTGPPKAAAASHRNYIAMIAGFFADETARRARRGSVPGSEVLLLTAPMFHSLGYFAAMKGAALGYTTVLVHRPSLAAMISTAGRYRVTSMTAVPPVVLAMSRAEGVELRDLRRVFCGGAPLQASAVERFWKRFPWIDIEQGYGLTEGGSIARMITSEECKNHRSVGKLNENVEAKIVDPMSGEALPVGFHGELWFGGPTIMNGYLGDDKANACIFSTGGWLKTGDIGYIDSNGYLYIVDRLKELIKYKAYQVAPAELEQLLHAFPEIDDAAVIPYPDDEAGEVPMAFVVRRPGSEITESQIMDTIAKQVAPYKRIRKVSFIESIPKNPSGKILRRELVSRAVSGCIARL